MAALKKWSFVLKEDGKMYLTVNGREAVDLFNRKFPQISDIRPGSTSSQILIKFAGKDRGSRYNREDFMEKDSLEIDTSSNPAFCRTAKLLIGCAEVQEVPDDNQPRPTPKKRRLNLANVEETAVEDNFPTKYIGVHEVPVALLQRPQPGMLARDIKVEWVKVLRDRLQRTTTLQTVLPVLVNPDEVTKKEDFSVENLERYNYMTLGGNHLREALQGLPVISESMKYIQCHIYVGLTEEEAIKLGNQHNAKNKHLCLTFQEKVRQARSLFLASDEKLRERLTDRLGILEMKEVNKESLSTILSVSRYSEAAYQCAQTLFEAFEGKCGVEKSIPQKIFRTLQGETEETRVRVLQMAEGTSSETAVTWYEKSIMRQQLQDTFQERTGCTSWEQAQASYPAHSQEIENLVGLSKKAAAKQLEEIACQAKEKINQMINVEITIKKGHFVMDNEEVQDIIKKYKKKIVQEVIKTSHSQILLNES